MLEILINGPYVEKHRYCLYTPPSTTVAPETAGVKNVKNIETEIGTLLSAAAVAALLGVSRTTVSTLVRYGELPAARVGRQLRIPEWGVRDYLNRAGLNPKKDGRNGVHASTAGSVSTDIAHPAEPQGSRSGVTVR